MYSWFVVPLFALVHASDPAPRKIDLSLKALPQKERPPEVPGKLGKGGVRWIRSAAADVFFAKTETTVLQFRACVAAGACKADTFDAKAALRYCNWGKAGRDDHPMNCVTTIGAEQFCVWVGARLPTEKEWIAEATDNGRREFPWGDQQPLCNRAVMLGEGGHGCGRDSTWPVCSKLEGNSASDLCDLWGNVWEATSTREGDLHAFRGAAFHSGQVEPGHAFEAAPSIVGLQSGARVKVAPTQRSFEYGFRCVSETGE